MPSLSCHLSVTGIRFLGVLFPSRDSALLTVGPPQKILRTVTGFPRSTRVRHGRVGCPLNPGGDGIHTTVEESSVVVCRLPAASLFVSPALHFRPGELP